MANQAQQPDPSAFNSGDDIDEILGRANPNPRTGGMSSARCSDCAGAPGAADWRSGVRAPRKVFAVLPGVPRASAGRRVEQLRWRRASSLDGCSCCPRDSRRGCLVSTFPTAGPRGRSAAAPEQVSATDLQAELDLRNYSVTRSEQTQSPPPPLSLQRGRLNVTILLPVGSEPGPYEVQVLDSELRSQATASGQADIKNYITTLQTTLDLRSLPPGIYQLALRRQGDEWRMFPARLK